MTDQLTVELPNYLLIGEERVKKTASGEFEHRYAGDGQVQQVIPVAGQDEVDRAVAAAKAALGTWGKWDGVARRQAIGRLVDLMGKHRDELAMLISREIGYPISASPFIVDWGMSWLDVTGSWADKIYGEVLPTPGFHNYSTAEPLGVIALIPTWNGSVGSFGMAVGPALAAGCTVVIKPSEFASFGPLRCAELALEAGIPPGVINVITGDADTGHALITHPDVEKLAFTGSPPTARKMAAALAPLLRPAVFELGGKSAVIVCEDADIDVAVEKAAMVSLGSGQQCTLGSRLLVHQSVHDEFASKLDAALGSVNVGDPMNPSTLMGPVVSEGSLERMLGVVERSRAYGTVRTGGFRLDGDLSDGYYMAPTVVDGVPNDSEISATELFGPVLTMSTYTDDAEALALANDSEYALAGYVFSKNIDRAIGLAHGLDTENIGINGAFVPLGPGLPFGGRKSSGYGKQGGRAGVMEFVRTRSVSIKLG